MIWLYILLILIIIISICAFTDPGKKESFKVPSYEINAACLYAAYNIEDADVEFIEKYHKQITFYVVNNGELTEAGKRLEKLRNVYLLVRDNTGYDAGAWKAGIDKWYNELSKFDLVLFVNNSCIYGINLLRFCMHAIDFDLYSHGFTWLRKKEPHQHPHFNTYMYAFHNRLFNSADFKEYWNSISSDNGGHTAAVYDNEYRLQEFFKERGYKLGNYVTMDAAELYAFHPSQNYSPEFIKKREIAQRPEQLQTFYIELENNRRKGY